MIMEVTSYEYAKVYLEEQLRGIDSAEHKIQEYKKITKKLDEKKSFLCFITETPENRGNHE